MEAFLGSSRTATYFTCLVLLIFCALVMTGWWYLLAPTLGQKAFAGLIAAVLTVIAAFSARQIGQYRASAIVNEEERRWYSGWRPYTFLAIISALGTLNAAFVLFESRAILRHDISTVRDEYSMLRDVAHQQLQLGGYPEKLAQIDSLLKNLHEEIVNPNGSKYCGVGRSALAIIGDITKIIPDYRQLNGSGPINPCDTARAEKVYESYAKMAHEMIKSDGSFLHANGPAKLSFLASLDSHYAQMDKDLAALEVAASGVGPADALDKSGLYRARDNYNSDRRTDISLSGDAILVPNEISSLQSDEVNSYASTIKLFSKRVTQPTTWFYLVLALAMDFAVIYLLTQLNVRFGRTKTQASDKFGPQELRFVTDPQYIWTNPGDGR
jgi:hypothetical protein